MTEASYSELLNQAEQAFANQDPRKGMTYVRQILNKDFTNDPAWQLLYRVIRAKQPFDVFQMELAKKVFPDQVHLLMEKELANLLQDVTPAAQESPERKSPVVQVQPVLLERTPRQDAQVSRIPDLRFCPQCGQERAVDMRFCPCCGFAFTSEAEKKVEIFRREETQHPQRQTTQQEQPRHALEKNRYEIEAKVRPEVAKQELCTTESKQQSVSKFSFKSAFLFSIASLTGSVLALTLITGSPGAGLITGIPAAIIGFIMGGFVGNKKYQNKKL